MDSLRQAQAVYKELEALKRKLVGQESYRAAQVVEQSQQLLASAFVGGLR